MQQRPAHAPYDGSSKPFNIGLKTLDLADWIEIGPDFDVQLNEKRRLHDTVPARVFVAEPGTEDAQAEVLDLLRDHLPARFPERYASGPNGVSIAGHPTLTEAEIRAMPPLKAASLLVQEDLILMRNGADGWRLAAGVLCFPSSWSLEEKFGKPMHEIHAPVPGFGEGTRMAELIARMFDRLQVPQPVYRFNWSIQSGDALFLPRPETQRLAEHALPSKFPGGDVAAAFIRIERQTLRKLPRSGDILFTIRIHLDPLAVLAAHPDRARLAAGLAEQIASLDLDQATYKGLAADRDKLVAALIEMAAA